ncbi:MAG: glycosyltransferase, partial [Gammaproteobacteria bacterium]
PFVQAASGDQEGLGLVAVEATACGCPVLVGNVPAARDIPVARIDVTDQTAFAAAITGILQHPDAAAALARDSRQSCLARFDWEVVAGGYADVLERQLMSYREHRS